MSSFDSFLLVSFGGPEKPEDVVPFLENVTRGRNIPRERLEEVGEHYYQFGGKSPINDQNKKLLEAIEAELRRRDIQVPLYFGNRNWDPYLIDALHEMKRDGKSSALAFFTSVFSCYSGCRQYRENILSAQEEFGEGAPAVQKLRNFYNHPGYISAMASRVEESLAEFEAPSAEKTHLVYTAHSIPESMAEKCRYAAQFQECSGLVSERAAPELPWSIAYQSRSGAPHIPWLEPDICDHISELARKGVSQVLVVPIGFVSDHMEVIFDLDTEAKEAAEELGMDFLRAGTAGTHPAFIQMIVDIFEEQYLGREQRPFCGERGATPDLCAKGCCLPGARPGRPGARPA